MNPSRPCFCRRTSVVASSEAEASIKHLWLAWKLVQLIEKNPSTEVLRSSPRRLDPSSCQNIVQSRTTGLSSSIADTHT